MKSWTLLSNAATTIGDTGQPLTTLTNLADGQLFGVGLDDNLYEINPGTGAAELIGATGLPDLSSANGYDNSLASK